MRRNDELNEERLRILGSRLAGLSLVDTVRYFPPEKEDRIVTTILSSSYPNVVDAASLELRLQLNGEFNILYLEDWAGERWACRWDRHPNTHNSRDHFHIPPRPHEEHAIDAAYPNDLNDVIRLVLKTVENRINDLWTATTDPVFPAEYEFSREYGMDYLTDH